MTNIRGRKKRSLKAQQKQFDASYAAGDSPPLYTALGPTETE